ncbi:hypothetical protein [Corynebacterium sp. p3-SID1194]|uniref:hypothetical protein n=1 Tax=Corynebacterium sp. p3-SID1194 TaxID=2916105 RepID=UPI0021A26AB5|nr:hypothetical protein [Corynebacterium sp. p3-SID1194]MCT1450659.1 hypothetical protein [Corynebacterium sp. p3-SID1194]
MTTYSSAYSYEESVVIPALGDDAGDYDTLAIAQDMLEWVTIPSGEPGWDDANKSGMVERADVDFWEVAATHCNDGTAQLARIVALDETVADLEDKLADAKARRDEAAKKAVESGVSKYSISQATGRTISSVQRWVQ